MKEGDIIRVAHVVRRGIAVIQSGKIDADEFYYLDTEAALGYVIEVGNNRKIREPERRFPA